MQDLVAPAADLDVRNVGKFEQAAVGIAQRQRADIRHASTLLRIQHHHQIRYLAVAIDLPDLHAFVGGLHRFEHRQGLQAQARRALVTQPH